MSGNIKAVNDRERRRTVKENLLLFGKKAREVLPHGSKAMPEWLVAGFIGAGVASIGASVFGPKALTAALALIILTVVLCFGLLVPKSEVRPAEATPESEVTPIEPEPVVVALP